MKKQLLLLFVMIVIVTSCVEQIDLEDYLPSEPSRRLVVEGIITTERKPHQIRLTRTGKALPDDPYEPVSNADVTITDGEFIYDLIESADAKGIYLTDSIQAEVGKVYTLTIKLDGEVYQASDKLVPVLQFGRAETIVLSSNHPPKGYIGTPLIIFGSNAAAMVSIEIDNPRPEDKHQQLDYYTFPGVDPDNIMPKYVEASLAYDEGTQLTQKKYSVSDTHYEFLRALLLETEYKGGIFGSVRANVPTNVSNNALGFFGACEVISRTGTIGKDGQLH